MNVNNELVGKAESFKKKEDENDELSLQSGAEGDEMGTAESSTLSTSFSIHGSLGSPSIYLDDNYQKVFSDQTKEYGLYTPKRRISSPSPSPCWRSCVVLFNDSPTSKDSTPTLKFEEYKQSDTPIDRRRAESHKTPLTKYSKHVENCQDEVLKQMSCGQKEMLTLSPYRKRSSLWTEVRTRQKQAVSIINDDPDYVGKLLTKVISENEQESESHSWNEVAN